MPKNWILKISEKWGLNANWLSTGKGEMLGFVYQSTFKKDPLLTKQEIPPYQVTIIEGKEIKPNEIALLDMYVKLSPESKEMVDYVTNKLYSMEYPKDKIAAPFNKHHKKPKKEK